MAKLLENPSDMFSLTVGKLYNVYEETEKLVLLLNDDGDRMWYSKRHFEEVM